MKKISLAMLITLLGAGLVYGCGDDDDDDDTVDCSTVTCTAVANADGVASDVDGECKCAYTCKTGYDKVDDASVEGGMKCVEKKTDDKKEDDKKDDKVDCSTTTCTAVANADGVASAVDGECKCAYTCKNGYKKVDDASAEGGMKCEEDKTGDDKECSSDTDCKDSSKPKCNESNVCVADPSVNNGCADNKECCEAKPCANNLTCSDAGKCLGKNGDICLGNDECESNYCDLSDSENGKCADKPAENPPVTDNREDCNTDADCNAAAPEGVSGAPEEGGDPAICLGNKCTTASWLRLKECADTDDGVCIGNKAFFCSDGGDDGAWSSLWDYETCDNGCEVVSGVAQCKAKEVVVVDPGVCNEANLGYRQFSCSGDADTENSGAFLTAVTKECKKVADAYDWVETTSKCSSGSNSCWPEAAALGCTAAWGPFKDNDAECYSNHNNCKSGYCTKDSVCADKQAVGADCANKWDSAENAACNSGFCNNDLKCELKRANGEDCSDAKGKSNNSACASGWCDSNTLKCSAK